MEGAQDSIYKNPEHRYVCMDSFLVDLGYMVLSGRPDHPESDFWAGEVLGDPPQGQELLESG